uniref:Immunoglobulin-like and fibronectin type III domain-containing protein 1 n=1 Tax=Poecilia reticulata TaxID=8081 RepID=A0A3P9PAA5_POERE
MFGPKAVKIAGKSRVPGVTITQFVEHLPAGKSTPDFARKPMTTTVQEGKKAFFKAMVSGEPPPTVTWVRNKGEMDDQEKYSTRYDERAREHVLEIVNVKPEQADNYKCFATNEYGQAACAVTLNVVEGMKIDPKLLELLLSAPKKDYERICLEFGVTDFRWLLKELKQIKKEREDEQSKVVENLDNIKQIEVKSSGRAEFSFDMKLRDPNSEVNLYKDGTLIPYDDDKNSKHSLQKTGINYLFSIKDPQREDAGFYQVDVEETNVLTTDFQAKIKDSKVTENEDAIFQCVLSTPLNKITWSKEDASLEHGGKYEITISEDKLTHTLRIKDCQMADKGAYYALAGITSSSAENDGADKDAQEKVEDGKEGRVGGEGGDGNESRRCLNTFFLSLSHCQNADRGVQFVRGLSDINAKVGERAELSCKLNSETSEGRWYKNGKLLTEEDGVKIIKDGACHILMIECCKKDDTAVYRFEAEGRKSEATLNIQDPPRLDPDALGEFTNPVIVRVGDNAEWKLPFSGGAPMNIQWYKNDNELLPAVNVKIDTSDTESQLRLTKCQRKDTGEVKIKIKNEFGVIEAVSRLIVLDKPTPPQDPVEITESAVTSVEFKWKPPKDSGGCPVTNYIIERQQVGRNKWTNLGEIPCIPSYKDTDVDPGRRYCYRIRAKNAEGISDYLQTGDIPAGYPGSPTAPKVVSAFKDCINLSWCPPCDTGGTKIIGYNLEKNKTGTNYWSLVNQNGPITVKDVFEGAEYRFRVSAINLSGAGEPSIPCEAVIARNPKKPPGKVIDLKITSSSYTTFSLAWTKPKEVKGVEDEAQGYYVEIRPIESLEWTCCNATPISLTSYTVLGLKAMASYWVRVIATNYGGNGEPQGFDSYIIAMPPPVRPKFKDRNMKTLMVVKSGNTIRVNINFEASPMPDISWVKDGIPLLKHVTITSSDRGSQLLIPTSERSDSGIYMITVKNIVGQESFSVEIRVTDDPKPPGPVELDENIPGTVTLCWAPSPDEKRDDRLHYLVSKRDSFKRTWRTAADNLFNNKFTVVNIMPGREYYFRVFAKNDMGLSPPSESPVNRKDSASYMALYETDYCYSSQDKYLCRHIVNNLRTAPEGYECYMSCAVKGDPAPRVTWYYNNISLNTNTNYHITNVCGVCSLLILRVGPKDHGEYRVIIENKLGNAESSMTLNVRGKL